MDTTCLISALDNRPHSALCLRYEYLSSGEIAAVFYATVFASLTAISYLVLEIKLTQDVSNTGALSLLQFFTTFNACVSALGMTALSFSLAILCRHHVKTRPVQTDLQTSMVVQNIYALSFVLLWSGVVLSQGVVLSTSDCPLYRISDAVLSCVRDFTSSLILFIFHWAALDHVVKKVGRSEFAKNRQPAIVCSQGGVYTPCFSPHCSSNLSDGHEHGLPCSLAPVRSAGRGEAAAREHLLALAQPRPGRVQRPREHSPDCPCRDGLRRDRQGAGEGARTWGTQEAVAQRLTSLPPLTRSWSSS